MGFDLGATVNSAADWVCNAPLVRGIVRNPIYTALLVTALAAIVAMALYGNQIRKAGLKRGARALLYMLLSATAVLFVHHSAVSSAARDAADQKDVRTVFASIQQSRDAGTTTPGSQPGSQPATGGGEGDCACPLATNKTSPGGDRALTIDDVVVPSALSPFARGAAPVTN
jgi:hypothetical protein